MAESGPQKASEPDPDASRHSETARRRTRRSRPSTAGAAKGSPPPPGFAHAPAANKPARRRTIGRRPRIPYEQQRLRRDERAIGGLDRAAAFHQQYLAQSQQYRAPAGEPTARETSPIPEATSYDARSYHSHSSASGSSGFFQQGPY